jgi:5-dehydro-4-deoxyglucarate dehydratase
MAQRRGVYAAAYKCWHAGVPVRRIQLLHPKRRWIFTTQADAYATQHRLLRDFFMPYLDIRNRAQGYAVSIVKPVPRVNGHTIPGCARH